MFFHFSAKCAFYLQTSNCIKIRKETVLSDNGENFVAQALELHRTASELQLHHLVVV